MYHGTNRGSHQRNVSIRQGLQDCAQESSGNGVDACLENYLWTLDLVDAMHEEWKYRYNHPPEKQHKSFVVATYLRKYAPTADKFPSTGLTPFDLAMPEECKSDDPLTVSITKVRPNKNWLLGKNAVNQNGTQALSTRDKSNGANGNC